MTPAKELRHEADRRPDIRLLSQEPRKGSGSFAPGIREKDFPEMLAADLGSAAFFR
jgi:hypothetical protein